jgi:hypothetical protein
VGDGEGVVEEDLEPGRDGAIFLLQVRVVQEDKRVVICLDDEAPAPEEGVALP